MKKILSTLLLFFIAVAVFAQTNFTAKSLLTPRTGKQELVNDFAGILSASQKQALEDKLVRFDDSTSTQIVVVIIPNLDGYEISDLAVQLGRAWGVGGKQFNNGVVLLISQKEHRLNISTGYGVEGALPDVTCNHIINDVIVPNFKGNDYYGGIDEGTDAIIKATKGEYTAPANYRKKGKELSPKAIIFIIILIIVFLSMIGKGGGGGGTFMSRRGIAPLFFFGGGGGGGFGGGGGGSSSGGGFGGFGGGSFGGGGSSGSW